MRRAALARGDALEQAAKFLEQRGCAGGGAHYLLLAADIRRLSASEESDARAQTTAHVESSAGTVAKLSNVRGPLISYPGGDPRCQSVNSVVSWQSAGCAGAARIIAVVATIRANNERPGGAHVRRSAEEWAKMWLDQWTSEVADYGGKRVNEALADMLRAYAREVDASKVQVLESQLAHARADITWLLTFVVEPEFFPNPGDQQCWEERLRALEEST